MDKEEFKFYKDNVLLDNEASYVPFGFAFQADAGIYLFCNYYENAESIKIESALQDIEIKKNDGKYIMAQAKAAQNPFNCKDYKSKLNDALFSLARHYVNSDDTLFYVSNIPNMFGNEMKNQFNDTVFSFNELSDKARLIIKDGYDTLKKKILDSLEDNQNTEKQKEKLKIILRKINDINYSSLCFLSISRYKDDCQKQSLKEKIASLLSRVFKFDSNKIYAIIDDLTTIWHEMFLANSQRDGSKVDKTISKDDFCWPIITINSMKRSPVEIAEYLDGKYDDSLADEIKSNYKKSYLCCYDYELVNKVLNDFKEFKSDNNSIDKRKEFINSNWEYYSTYFRDSDELIQKGTTIYFLYELLSDRYMIANVLRGK